MDDREIGYLPATALRSAFAAGELAPSEVVLALARRIARQAPQLNALGALDVARCLRDAEVAAQRFRAGAARPLEGIPVLVKDLIDTGGLTTTYGSRMFVDHVPVADAPAVARIRAAGGLILGKTATHEFAWGITTDGTALGPTRNPWDLSLVPGGSSGGSGAALAAGFAPLAVGTDTAGSIRIPAALCGVIGLKPTFGAVDTAGVFPLAPSLDHVGPMARTADDAELLARVLGVDVDGRRPDSIVAGICDGLFPVDVDADLRVVVDAALDALPAVDVRVRELTAPVVPDAAATLATVVSVEGVLGHREAGLWPARRDEYLPAVRHRIERSEAVGPTRYAAAARDRSTITAAMDRLLTQVDVLISPATAVPAAPVGLVAVPGSGAADAFRAGVMAFTAIASLTGQPACAVPVGFDSAGRPVGVQIIGSRGGDAVVLETARRLDSVSLAGRQAHRPLD